MEINLNLLAIIESLRLDEVHTGTELSDYLQRRTLPIAVELYQPKSAQDFFALLDRLAARVQGGGCSPIVHLEAHGDSMGIETTTGEEIGWEQVGEALRPINIAMRNSLIVTTAVCHGGYIGIAAAHNPSKPAPFCGTVGPNRTADREDLLNGFRAFFIELLESGDFATALHELQARNLPQYRALDMGDLFRRGAQQYVRSLTPDELGRRANRNVDRMPAVEVERRGGRERAVAAERERLADFSARLDERWKKFIMADLYPENLERFKPLRPAV